MREQIIKNTILPVVVILLSVVCAGRAADSGDPAGDNAELKQRIEELDRELAELKRDVGGEEQTTDPLASKKPLWSSLDIQLYGYLKLDAAYDTSRVQNGNFAQWVEREDTNDDDDQFNMTANQSRFGVLITGPADGEIKASGRAEVDFYEGGAENKPRLMMRHAYMKLDWPDDRFSVIAGQTSDVISPLYPTTVNYSVGWWTGNIGYRRPQIRLTKDVETDSGRDVKLEGAVTRTIGRDSIALAGTTDSGEDSGRPTLQGRVSTTVDLFDVAPSAIGVSAHYGTEEYDTAPDGSSEDFRTWSLNVDLVQPVNEWLEIKSEVFTGENLNAYLGGIGQGVTLFGPNQFDEIGSTGGWMAASLGPWDDRQYNIGIAIDDVDRGDVNNGARTSNRSIFANMFWAISRNVDWALELSHWRTNYAGPGDADSFRIQTAFIYKF
ncbi:MAG: DcaP family trimeric outer membrane transporter [Planctomycetota bacterium]